MPTAGRKSVKPNAMNAGLIASRYANALLLFAKEERTAKRVYDDARSLLDALPQTENLAACIESLSPTMQKFITLVIRNKRVEFLPAILNAYRAHYRSENGITRAWLTTATENPELADKLVLLMKQQGFSKVDDTHSTAGPCRQAVTTVSASNTNNFFISSTCIGPFDGPTVRYFSAKVLVFPR